MLNFRHAYISTDVLHTLIWMPKMILNFRKICKKSTNKFTSSQNVFQIEAKMLNDIKDFE